MQAYQLYSAMNPELVHQQFQWMRDEERELYATSIATLAESAKLRPAFVRKKSVTDQINWIHKQLKAKKSNMVGEHLLQGWFMKGQEKMLVTFCDAMGIKHDGKGAIEEEFPEEFDETTLKSAVDALFSTFPANITSLYLYVFNIQTENGWESLNKLLAEDERVTLV